MTARAHFVLCLAAVLALCLAAPAQPSPVSPKNPYNRRLEELESRFQQPGVPAQESAVILARAYGLRDRVDDPPAFDGWMEHVAAAPGLNPLVRDEALRYVALDQIHAGRLEDAQLTLRKLGFLRDWAVLGPFPPNEAPDAQRDLTLKAPFPVQGKTILWRPLPDVGPHPWIDLSDFYPQAEATVIFAATSVRADVPTSVALRFTAESAVTLYFNGRELFRDDTARGPAFDQHSIGVVLHPGWNTIVLKLRRESDGPWRFGLRITAPAGGGISMSASVAPSAIVAANNTATVPVSDLVETAARRAQEMRADPRALAMLGDIEQLHATGAPFEHLEAAAQAAPTAQNWLATSELCPDTSCVFTSLTSALRAQPESEPAKLAFAEYYLARGQVEKARDLLLDALQLEPGDFVARKRLADVELTAGSASASAAQYRQVERESPASIWSRRQLASHYEDIGLLDRARALVSSALRDDFDGAEERALLLRVDERRLDGAALRSDYEAMRRLSPTDVLPLEKLAALDLATGERAAAVVWLRQALSVAPGSAGLHQQLADAFTAAGRSAEARRELTLAAALDPRDTTIPRRLRESAAAPSADPESQYLADAAALATAVRRSDPATSGEAVMLANIRVQRLFANGLSAVRQQQVLYLASDEAAADYATSSIQYSPATEKVELLNARVFKRNGAVVQGEEAGENAVADRSVSMYYDVRSRVIRFPGMEKGDVIELDYRTSPASGINRFGDYFGDLVPFRGALAESLQRYVLIAPASRRLSIGEQRMPTAVRSTGADGEQIYRWEMREVPALANEPRGPALTEVAPYVLVSSFTSWDELGRWYAQLIRPQFALDRALREAVNGLLAGARTDEQKIRAIHDFVVRNTHYVALEFGIYGFKPYPVSQTYARRFGDCKDKASLMIALLRAAGIDAEIALVRTRRLGDIGQQPASISIFNHAVVYIPKYQLWLDGTAEYSGSHELPLDDQGAMALTVSLDGRAQLRRIPVSTVADNVTRRIVHAQVLHDGRVQFSGNFDTRGEDAPVLRRDYEVPERQRDQVRDRLAEVFPTIRVEDVRVEGAHDLDRDVSVNFRGVLDTFAGRSTFSLATSWMPRAYVQTLAPLATRGEDLVLVAPWQTQEEIHLSIPRSATYVSIPRDQRLETPFGTAVLRYELNGRDLTVRTVVQFRAGRIAPADYPAFRDFCAQVERSFRNEIKVSLAR